MEDLNPRCWIAEHIILPGPCDGHLIRGHLIAKQTIRREAQGADLYDPRCWVPICGGITGIGGHHGMLDYAKTIRIPRDALPPAVEEFAAEYGLVWWLERTYGPQEMAA
jgi:hypothetical protein